MRVGKRANVVEAKRTRSCVVRLENIASPPTKSGGKITRSAGVTSRAHIQTKAGAKKYKASAEKRPIAHGQIAAAMSKAVGRPPNTAQTRLRHGDHPNVPQTTKSKFSTPNAPTQRTSIKSVTPNSAQSAKSKSNTPNSAQTSKSGGTPNSAQAASKSKSGTPNSIQLNKSKSGTPNSAQLSKLKSVTPNSAQQASAKASVALTKSTHQQPSASRTKDAAKDTFKTPLKLTKSEQTKAAASARAPTPPSSTIAAGRSRRAIKPNPKYASEDILTPKMIRNVGTTSSAASGGAGSTAKKSTNSSTKKRKASTSSSDDFYNNDDDSTDDESDKDDFEKKLDKMYSEIIEDSDSDFTDDSRMVNTRNAKQAKQVQQRKTPFVMPTTKLPIAPTARPTPTGGSHKGQPPSQLQLLRKSFAASVNRTIVEPKAAIKRPRNDSVTASNSSDNNDVDASGIARKRLMLTKTSPSNVATSSRDLNKKSTSSSEITLPVRKPTQQQQIPNGSKIIKLKMDGPPALSEEPPKRNVTTRVIERRTLMDGPTAAMKISQQTRFQPIVRSTNNTNNKSNTTTTATSSSSTATTTSTTRTLITMPIKTQNARGLSLIKRRSASPAVKKASPPKPPIKENTPPPNESIVDENKSTEAENLSSTIEDFETMPTFTIVNINDIINKKGDVLISKSDKSLHTDDSDMSDDYDLAEIKSTAEYKKPVVPERRKLALPTTKKINDDIRRSKSPKTTTTTTATAKILPTQKILNHTLLTQKKPALPTNTNAAANRNKMNSSITPDKPAPRILNSVVAKKTQPVKPMIANFEDSENEDTYQLSLDGDDDIDLHDDDADADEVDDDDTNERNVAPRRHDYNDIDDADDDDDPDDTFNLSKRKLPTSTPYTTKKKTTQPPAQAPPPPTAATKENSQTALNRQLTKTKSIEQRKAAPEKVVISRQGDKVIKKITCFETWYVIVNDEVKPNKEVIARNILEIPLIKLANVAADIKLPNADWKGKVTLHELTPTMLAKTTTNLTLFTGDLKEFNIAESDRGRYQPSCVMFRRTVNDRTKSRLPYDRAVIFKNRTFFTNIDGKNVKLVGAPSIVQSQEDVEILLQLIDSLTLENAFVEPASTMQ